MYLEKINQSKLIQFAESEFGNITTMLTLKSKATGDISYNMTFRLKENGAYEEAYFYDFEIFPIRMEDMDDRKIAGVNKRFATFMIENLPKDVSIKYNEKYNKLKEKKENKI